MVGPTALDPDKLHPARYVLAKELQDLFARVEEDTVSEYARKHHRDKSTVSKALSGKEVPTWDFVKDLANSAARKAAGHGAAAPEMLAYLLCLHEAALETCPKRGHVSRNLYAELQRSQLEVVRREKAEATLIQQRDAARHVVALLSSELKAIESGKVKAISPAGAEEMAQGGREIQSKRESIEDLLTELNIQVAEECQARELAEQRCRDLEELLRLYDEALFPPEEDEVECEFVDDEEVVRDGHRVAINPAQRYSAAFVQALRAELDLKNTEILGLRAKLRMVEDELEQARSAAPEPLPVPIPQARSAGAQPPQPRHRRPAPAVFEPYVHEGAVLPPEADWSRQPYGRTAGGYGET